MKRMGKVVVALAVVGICGIGFAADKPRAAVPPPTSQPATMPYDQLVQAYLANDFDTLASSLKTLTMRVNSNKLTPAQRVNVEYIRRNSQEERPKWWAGAKSSANSSFQAMIWGRNVMTNYVPADSLGVQEVVGVRDGRLVIVVAWRPTYVDNPRPADGAMAKSLHVTKGDIGEVVVWHELGHLYMTSALSLDAVTELYRKYRSIASHLQEFFADMTAIAHCSPPARRVSMILRLDELDPPDGKYDEMEPHTRAANAIGAAFLAEVLSNRSKWPNVHLPAEVPEQDVELRTIVYMYEHFTKDWTLEEDKEMKEWAQKLVRSQGDHIFRSKGMIPLPEGNKFSLLEPDDREFQKKRNAWVKERLGGLIAKGDVDKPQPKPKEAMKNGKVAKSGQRIEVPDY